MPYIPKEKRKVLDPHINALCEAFGTLELDDEDNNTEGNINYSITSILRRIYGKTGYKNINDVMGLMLSCALEHYMTVAFPYEQDKKTENGDVPFNSEPTLLDGMTIEFPNELIKNPKPKKKTTKKKTSTKKKKTTVKKKAINKKKINK